jgi:hypothetical protein
MPAFAAAGLNPTPTPAPVGMKPVAEQLTGEAQALEQAATGLAQSLRDRKADFAGLSGQFDGVTKGVERVQGLVSQLEGQTVSMSARQLADFNRVRELVKMLGVFANNKKDLLGSGDLAKNREAIRGNVLSVAIRAGLIRKSAARLQS